MPKTPRIGSYILCASKNPERLRSRKNPGITILEDEVDNFPGPPMPSPRDVTGRTPTTGAPVSPRGFVTNRTMFNYQRIKWEVWVSQYGMWVPLVWFFDDLCCALAKHANGDMELFKLLDGSPSALIQLNSKPRFKVRRVC